MYYQKFKYNKFNFILKIPMLCYDFSNHIIFFQFFWCLNLDPNFKFLMFYLFTFAQVAIWTPLLSPTPLMTLNLQLFLDPSLTITIPR